MPPQVLQEYTSTFVESLEMPSSQDVEDCNLSTWQYYNTEEPAVVAIAIPPPTLKTTSSCESATKGNRRAKHVHREIRKGSVFDLVELLKDRIPMDRKPGYCKQPARPKFSSSNCSKDAWPQSGTVRKLADYLKDKIPMVTPESAPGKMRNNPVHQTSPKWTLPDSRHAATDSPTSVVATGQSVHEMVVLLRDKLALKSPLDFCRNARAPPSGCCQDTCLCCGALDQLLVALEAAIDNRVVVQWEGNDAACPPSHEEPELGSLVIPPNSGDRRQASRCSLFPFVPVEMEPEPNGVLLNHRMKEATEDDKSLSDTFAETDDSFDESSTYTNPISEWSLVEAPPPTTTSNTATSTASLSQNLVQSVFQTTQSVAPKNSPAPIAIVDEDNKGRMRLRREYVLSDRALRSKRDFSMHHPPPSDSSRIPWDRSRYDDWRHRRPVTTPEEGEYKK